MGSVFDENQTNRKRLTRKVGKNTKTSGEKLNSCNYDAKPIEKNVIKIIQYAKYYAKYSRSAPRRQKITIDSTLPASRLKAPPLPTPDEYYIGITVTL